jgi:hypothetical protein
MGCIDCSESCSALRLFTEDTDPSASTTIKLISKLDLREMGCENGRWMELAQDRVQWQALVLAVLNLQVQLQGVS